MSIEKDMSMNDEKLISLEELDRMIERLERLDKRMEKPMIMAYKVLAKQHPEWKTLSKSGKMSEETIKRLYDEVSKGEVMTKKDINEKPMFESNLTDTTKGVAMHPSGIADINERVRAEAKNDPFKQHVIDTLASIQAQNANMQLSIEKLTKVFDMIVKDYLSQIVTDLDEIDNYGKSLQEGEVSKEDIEGLANRIHLAQETIAMLDNSPAISHASEDMRKIVNGAVMEIKMALEKEREDVKAYITEGVNHLTIGTNKVADGLGHVASDILSDIKTAKFEIAKHIQNASYEVRRTIPGSGRDPMR